MIELKHVYKKYDSNNNYALKNINIKLPTTGFISIVGESGSGKSTLLNLIGGLDTPTKGSIIINCKNIANFNKDELDYYHNKYVSFIFQDNNLIDYLSVKDNINILNNNNINYYLNILNINNLLNKKISNLSGGEQERVSIARALTTKPKILLCDEPTSSLDSKSSENIAQLLKELSKSLLVILVTHNTKIAKEYSDQIITIKDGNIISNRIINRKSYIKNYFKTEKIKIGNNKIFKIVKYSFLYKLKRNIFIIIAISIGLISLSLVLGISKGFNKAIDREEKNSLSEYPIYISKTSNDIESTLFKENNNYSDNKIHLINGEHINTITKEYLNYVDNINTDIKYKTYIYSINDIAYQTNSLINTSSFNNEFTKIYGNNITNNNDVILVIDSNNQIDKNSLFYLNLTNNEYDYKDLINYEYNINDINYKIVGIYKSDKDNIFKDMNGLIYNYNNFKDMIPISINIYPYDYESKQNIISHLSKYSEITYYDYSNTIKKISSTIVNSISIILILFSCISLLISTIMIGIITYINVLERTKEIGILKSLGLPNKYIKNIFYLESLLILLISFIISIIITLVISIPVNNILTNITGLDNILILNINNILILFGISMLISILGTFIPVRKISKLKIIDVLKS